MASLRDLGEAMRQFGLGFPGTREDHPWGELVLKVKDKVFVFLGKPSPGLSFSVKLPRSGERLLDQPYAEPTGYGLGKSGWVTLTIEDGATLSRAELCALVEESYRAVAPKTLLKQLDGGGAAAAEKPAAKKAPVERARGARKPPPKKQPAARKA